LKSLRRRGRACLKGKSGGLKLNHQNSKVTGCEHEGLSQNGYGAIIDKTPLHRRTIGRGYGCESRHASRLERQLAASPNSLLYHVCGEILESIYSSSQSFGKTIVQIPQFTPFPNSPNSPFLSTEKQSLRSVKDSSELSRIRCGLVTEHGFCRFRPLQKPFRYGERPYRFSLERNAF